MKPILLTSLLLVAACTSSAPRRVTITPPISSSRLAPAGALRSLEQVREYRLGRYADPGDPLTMHEAHPVYRIEATPKWNLRPGTARPPEPAGGVLNNDAVLAEINKQRTATRVFTEQATTLNQRLGELSQAAAQSQDVARQHLALQHDLAGLRERLDAFDAQARERRVEAAARPAAATEDKW